jgi:hypothetical protein
VGWDYQVPLGAGSIVWEIVAKAGSHRDKLKITQKVGQATPVHLPGHLAASRPTSVRADAGRRLPGRGGLQTSFVAKLGGELPGVREYMAAYPYLLRAKHVEGHRPAGPEAWNKLAASCPLPGRRRLAEILPIMEQGSDSLTAYVLSATAEAGYAIPEQTKNRMEEALTAFVQGKIVRRCALATDLAVRKLAALEALSRSRQGATRCAGKHQHQPNLWPTSAVIDWSLLLQRTPSLARRDALLAEAQQICVRA